MDKDTLTPIDAQVGVIVARIQVDDLHAGHLDLFREVYDSHERMFVVIGLAVTKCTIDNPLDFDSRRRMVMEYFPQAVILYIEDVHLDDEEEADRVWSANLDTIIARKLRNGEVPLLYGSRKSFIAHYYGKYATNELEQTTIISGTEIRGTLAIRSKATQDFRAGAIWFSLNQYNNPLPTADMAVLKRMTDGTTRILLGRKDDEVRHRLPGGFAESGDTYEQTAVRELKEETNLVCEEEDLTIEKSFFVNCSRFKNEARKITTTLYTVCFDDCEGEPRAGDDLKELQWFPFDDDLLGKDLVNRDHREMIAYLLNKY